MPGDARIEVTAVESKCARVKVGDKMYFNGPMLDLEGTDVVCCTALVGIYPLVCALRYGADPAPWGHEDKIVAQCPDLESMVKFEIRRIE